MAALAVIEATVRLIPGALGDEGSAEADSFSDGILDFPHYTRPAVVRGLAVPDVLLSGDHGAHPAMAPQGGAPGHPRAAPGPRATARPSTPRTAPCCDEIENEDVAVPREGEVKAY